MDTISKRDNWELFKRDGISYYVFAKFVEDSWTGYIECRTCPENGYKDESFPHNSPEEAMIGAKNKVVSPSKQNITVRINLPARFDSISSNKSNPNWNTKKFRNNSP